MNFTIKERCIKCDTKALVGDNADYMAYFAFDEEWDGKIKTARFVQNGRYKDVILSADSCKIPVEILKQGFLNVGIFSTEMTTTQCEIYVASSIKETTGIPAPPTADVYKQIMELIENMVTGEVSEEQIAAAVEIYLTEHPIESMTKEDVQQATAEYIEEYKAELKGEPGEKGEPGNDGKDGEDGTPGKDGSNGFSPVITENADNSDDTYKLDIETAASKFTTPNLKGTDGKGALTTQQIEALDNMFKIASFTEDPTNAYEAFKNAFGLGLETVFDDATSPTYVATSILSNGTAKTYNGWQSSEMVDVSAYDLSSFQGIELTGYNYNNVLMNYVSFYDEDETYISGINPVSIGGEPINGDSYIGYKYSGAFDVPANTKYIRITHLNNTNLGLASQNKVLAEVI